MRPTFRSLLLVAAACTATGCLNPTGASDGGGFFAIIRGTVTRTGGAAVPNARVGVSCVGTSNEPFGFTGDADANGRFDVRVNASTFFAPLEGPSYVCRVLTPLVGLPQAEKSISVRVGTSQTNRPVTEVSLVTP
jgi:hypothetical protein